MCGDCIRSGCDGWGGFSSQRCVDWTWLDWAKNCGIRRVAYILPGDASLDGNLSWHIKQDPVTLTKQNPVWAAILALHIKWGTVIVRKVTVLARWKKRESFKMQLEWLSLSFSEKFPFIPFKVNCTTALSSMNVKRMGCIWRENNKHKTRHNRGCLWVADTSLSNVFMLLKTTVTPKWESCGL